MQPLLPLQLCLLQPPQHLCVAIVAVVHEREPAATSGQLLTRLPWLRRPPVLRWMILLPVALSTYFLSRLLHLGGAEWCQWRGPTCQPSPPSTWMAPPLLLLPLHRLHLHPHNLSAMTTATSMSDTAKPVEGVSFCALSMLVVLVTQLQKVFGTRNLNTTNFSAQFAIA